MPRDARLGFVMGVTLVIVIAVIFYHGDGTAGTTGNVGMPPPTSAGSGKPQKPTLKNAHPTPLPGIPSARSQVRSHTVKEGETLQALAKQYYGDETQASTLFRANRSQLRTAEELPAGTVLVVPELPGR